MRKVLISLLVAVFMFGFGQEVTKELPNNPADGNVTMEESRFMQKQWCEYNKGKEIAREQCEDIWND